MELQPIETCPTNKLVDIWVVPSKKNSYLGPIRMTNVTLLNGEWFNANMKSGDVATHWMPLPEPPPS